MKPEPFSKNRFKLNLDGIDHAFQVLAFKDHEAIPATAKTCNWKPFTNDNRRLPGGDLSNKRPLYWQVEINEHPL
ncbi:hypothetical protein [Pseudomonas viridiflava]|uniref:hypothetical protein n=1 Tax=Pseudomonas viridiflava TaxID=33069 RepID=UPI0013CEB5C2|nr:hypothetical protein [Pseudomonas viridiflava]